MLILRAAGRCEFVEVAVKSKVAEGLPRRLVGLDVRRILIK